MTQDQWEEGKALLKDMCAFMKDVQGDDKRKFLVGACRYLYDFMAGHCGAYYQDRTEELGERP